MTEVLVWRVWCETCPWHEEDLEDREPAVALGYDHINEEHMDDERYSFRVQGIRPRRKQSSLTQLQKRIQQGLDELDSTQPVSRRPEDTLAERHQ